MTQSTSSTVRILLVEDEVDARRAIAHYLENRGHTVSTAGTAAEAIASAAQALPDVIVCDWRLNGDNGVEVVRQLQRFGRCAAIFVTAEPLAELRSAAADLDVFSFLRKPVTLERIAAEVENAHRR